MGELTILPDPPCQHCTAVCCKQKYREYAVMLDDDENFPEAVDFQESPNETIKVIPYQNGKCVFLGDDDRCTIYDRRPKLCREFNCVSTYGTNCFFSEDHPEVMRLIEEKIMGTETLTAAEQFVEIARWKNWRWGTITRRTHNGKIKGAKIQSPPNMMFEIHRVRYGAGDGRAINRHSERDYMTESGTILRLDKTLDALPNYYELGMLKMDYTGFIPVIKIDGQDRWGEGLTWNQAIRKVCDQLGVTLAPDRETFERSWELSAEDKQNIDCWNGYFDSIR